MAQDVEAWLQSVCGTTQPAPPGLRPAGPSVASPTTAAPLTEEQQAILRRAQGFLARRAHATAELRGKLADDEVDPADVDEVLERLQARRLLDDETFAAQWVAQRKEKRSPALLRVELENKGVADDVIEAALQPAVDTQDEEARRLALRQLGRLKGKSVRAQAASIMRALLRRGFDEDVATAATKSVLPPEGWD